MQLIAQFFAITLFHENLMVINIFSEKVSSYSRVTVTTLIACSFLKPTLRRRFAVVKSFYGYFPWINQKQHGRCVHKV